MNIIEYNKCVESYADGAYRFVLKNIGDEEKAKDIIQDSFEKMWVKHKEVVFEKSKSYLYTTAYHTMIDYIRKDKKFSLMDDSYYNKITCENSFNDLKEVIDEALKTLPDIQRSLILLRDYEGYPYDEIGKITGLNESQVKVYIFRARTTLKNYIGTLENVI